MTRSRRRPSYTLLELLLVCAVLVIVSALTVPSIDSMYGYYKMNAAVDSVKAAMVQARSAAIADGQPYRFCVVPGHGNYRVAPDANDYWSGGGQPTPPDPNNPPTVVEDVLPTGVNFAMGQNGSAPASAPANGGSSAPVGQVDPGSWSAVTVFLPDGTARDDVEIVFQVKGARTTAVQLRALTGIVTSKPVDEGGGP
jgi:Tfp pilus assembly protein FimT